MNDSQNEKEWKEYFACSKKYDRKFSPEMVKKISDTIMHMKKY